MHKVLAILLAGGAGERLYPLTRNTAKPAVPFGGVYRIIDFTLSNCINSNIRRVFILTQYKALELHRHVREGWNILSPELGEYIEVFPPMKRIHEDWYLGTADAVFQNTHSIIAEDPARGFMPAPGTIRGDFLHIHIPEGAIPKDGPSAGITMATALVSAFTGRAVRAAVAMTGEITLRGEVLPIGGLKEKLLAAHRGGIRTVLIPDENVKDLAEIPDNIKGNLDIKPVKWIDEVLALALKNTPQPLAVPAEAAEGAGVKPAGKRSAKRSGKQVHAH